MKVNVQVKLLPTPVQAAALAATLHACNEAATWASEVAFAKDTKRNFTLREHTYGEIKQRWGLGAQAAQHVIKKTCDAYATLKANLTAGHLGKPWSRRYQRATEKPIAFRPRGAQPYDDRMLSWQIPDRTVSIWTLAGRLKGVAFTASLAQLARLALYRKGESDLIARDGMWFLNATCEVPEAEPNTSPDGFLGIDLGIVNIATTSDGKIMAGRRLNRTRTHECDLRTKLLRKKTPLRQAPLEEAAAQGNPAGQRHQPQDREVCGGRGRTHRSRNRPGRSHRHPRTGTASQAPTGRPLLLGLCPAGSVHRVQSPPCGRTGGARRSGVHLTHLRRMRAPRQGEPGLPGLLRLPVMRIR